MYGGFEIFDPDGEGQPGGLTEIMALCQHAIDEHDMDIREALGYIIDMIRPGNSDNSHDVKPMWAGAMWAKGFGHVAEKVAGMYLNTMPWGLGFAIAIEPDFSYEALSAEAQRAMIESLAVVIRMGGITAEVSENNTIRVTLEDGGTSDITVDNIVGQFRKELDQELGPDAPEKGHGHMGRWMP